MWPSLIAYEHNHVNPPWDETDQRYYCMACPGQTIPCDKCGKPACSWTGYLPDVSFLCDACNMSHKARPEPITLRTVPVAAVAVHEIECKEKYYGLECTNTACTQREHRLRRQQ